MGFSIVPPKSRDAIAAEWDRLTPFRRRAADAGMDYSLFSLLIPTVVELLEPLDTASVLDAGCGAGHTTAAVAVRSGKVLAVDISPVAIAIASDVCGELPNVAFRVAAIEEVAATDVGEFTTAVAQMVFMNVPDLDQALQGLRETLVPGGHLVATLTHPWFWPSYWGFDEVPGFHYDAEIVIETPFRLSRLSEAGPVVTHTHRPLAGYLNALTRAGFALDEVREIADPLDEVGRAKFLALVATRL